MTPHKSLQSLKLVVLTSPTSTFIPRGFALVLITARLWGNTLFETYIVFFFSPNTLKHIAIASAAAVPSSNKEAFETGIYVNSVTIV